MEECEQLKIAVKVLLRAYQHHTQITGIAIIHGQDLVNLYSLIGESYNPNERK